MNFLKYKHALYRYKAIIVLTILIFCPQKSDSFRIGPLKIGGWVGKQIDNTLGSPMEAATNSALENMQAKLDNSIKNLDIVMAKNVSAFNSDLKDREVQLDTLLKNRLGQLDTLLNRNIDTLNARIEKSLKILDENVNNAFAKASNSLDTFDKSLSDFIDKISYAAILIITMYFVFKTYDQYKKENRRGNLNFFRFINSIKFYLIGGTASIIILLFTLPYISVHVNKSYEERRKQIENDLSLAVEKWRYAKSEENAKLLTSYDQSNNYYQYGLKKVKFITQIFIRSNELNDNNTTLYEKYDELENDFTTYKIKDSEFLFLQALYKTKFLQTKKASCLAALNCLRFLERNSFEYDPTDQRDSIFEVGGLTPMAANIISSYDVNPYNTAELTQLFKDEKIIVSPNELNLLSGDTSLSNKVNKFYKTQLTEIPASVFYSKVFSLIDKEQEYLYNRIVRKSLNPSDQRNLIKQWADYLNWLSKQKQQNLWATKSLEIGDGITYALLKNFSDNSFLNMKKKLHEDPDNANLKPAILKNIDSLFIYRRAILAKVLSKTQSIDAQVGKSALILRASKYYYSRIDSLLNYSDRLPVSDSAAYETYSKLIQWSSDLNIYYRNKSQQNRKEPLSFYYINLFEKQHRSLLKKNPSFLSKVKSNADSNLKNSFYQY